MNPTLQLVNVIEQVKHLPGQHDQADHGHGRVNLNKLAPYMIALAHRKFVPNGKAKEWSETISELKEALGNDESKWAELKQEVTKSKLREEVDKAFADEYPQPLDAVELVSVNAGPLTHIKLMNESIQEPKKSGEGGEDDTWYHDDVDGEVDDEWQREIEKLGKEEKLKSAIYNIMRSMNKHLPGQHNQMDHAPKYDKKMTGDFGSYSQLEGQYHYRRLRMGEKEVTKKLKSGESKKVTVPIFRYIDSDGKMVDDERLSHIKLPPGVSDVRINPDPNGQIIASWMDSKGRGQGLYSKAHTIGRAAEKFARLRKFHKALPELRKQIADDLESSNPKIKEIASILYLIDKTAFRIGNTGETLADKKAYGASTLLNKHVRVDGDKVSFNFIGKKGVNIRKTVVDSKLAKIVRDRKTEKWSQPLFDRPSGIREYLQQHGDFSPKDFRTWHAADQAVKQLNKIKRMPKDEKQFNKIQKIVATKVAKHLGNTPGVTLNSYIDPHIWSKIRKPEWGQWVPKSLREDKSPEEAVQSAVRNKIRQTKPYVETA